MTKIKCPGCEAEIDTEKNEAHFHPHPDLDSSEDGRDLELCEIHETELTAGVCNECQEERDAERSRRRNRFKR